jgi:hypothetical protein
VCVCVCVCVFVCVSMCPSKVRSQFSLLSLSPGCVLVTDAIAAMGLEAGTHRLGGVSVHLDEQHRATVSGTDTLAGRCAFVRVHVCVCVCVCVRAQVRVCGGLSKQKEE